MIGGRKNLAESENSGSQHYHGYRQDFPEERLYAKSLSEFSRKDISDYFVEQAPQPALDDAGLVAIAEFTLGIPYAVNLAATMWREGASLQEILAPATSDDIKLTARQRIIKQLCERFLKHCILHDNRDRSAIYALALMRRPDADLLRVMLEANDLEPTLQSLRARYSFIIADETRLDDKLKDFLREYLLFPIRRNDSKFKHQISGQLHCFTRDSAHAFVILQAQRTVWTI